MSAVPTSSDVAIWLRFQIAAGRFADTPDLTQMNLLAQKLGVNVATVSAAYHQLGGAGGDYPDQSSAPPGCGRFGVIADLVDQIVELDRPDLEVTTEF